MNHTITNLTSIIGSAFAISLLSGCATIVSGTGQSLTVVTEKSVEDASCELTDKKGGKWYIPHTPGTATVHKGDGPMTVVCKKDGYKTATLMVEESLTGATFGNIILGGGIGILVDAASGAAQQYPDQVVVWMEPETWESEDAKNTWYRDKEAFEVAEKDKNKTAQPNNSIETN